MKIMMFFLTIIWMMTAQNNLKYNITLVHSVDSVKVVKAEDNRIILHTISAVPNPCHKYSHYTLERTRDTLNINIFSKIEKNVNCIQMIGKMEAEIKIPVEKKGPYHVVFTGEFKQLVKDIEVK